MSVAIAVTIAGSDSSGGAGIEADLKTFSALGVYGGAVVTAVTAQNTERVLAIHEVPADFIGKQIDAVLSDLDAGAVKIGMLGSAAAVREVIAALERHHPRNVVLDPVMVASSGDQLLKVEALDSLRELIARVDLVTPNLLEAATLLHTVNARGEDEMLEQARKLKTTGVGAVLIKGGHGGGPESVDLLVSDDGCIRLAAPRVATKNTHGTGCTFASAIAAGLAKGFPLERAARDAKTYISAAIAAADRLGVGRGRGPLHHFHDRW